MVDEPTFERARPRVVVIEDDENVLRSLTAMLRKSGFDTVAVSEPLEGLLASCDPDIDVVLSDVQMPNLTGLDLLAELKRRKVDVQVVLMSGYASAASAVEAMKAGAYDYLVKPFDEFRRVQDTLSLAAERRLNRRQAHAPLGHEARSPSDELVGRSAKMAEVFRLVESVAPTSATVVIQGESGTGKELVARALHRRSLRADKPFITVNCGAVTETLLESELFGYVKGAFTGALTSQNGLFQAADGGTLLLDEIGEMPMGMQVRLLRVLQEGEVRQVGSTTADPVDVRVIAATNVNLEEAVKQGKFREDLFYRLNVILLELPSLRDRPEDIAPLAEHFLDVYGRKLGKKLVSLSAGAMSKLLTHGWPGNVRELENVIERAAVLARGDQVTETELPATLGSVVATDLDAASLSHLPLSVAKELAVTAFERRYLASLLRKKNGNISQAAKAARVDRANFRRLLKLHGLTARVDAAGED